MDQIKNIDVKFVWPDEFVDLDLRKRPRLRWQSYQISQEFFWHRHSTTLPAEMIAQKTVLDLGCYLGATGHWCLSHGCSHYTGVELISEYLAQAQGLLSRHPSTRFSLVSDEIDRFLSGCQDHYDVVVAWGVLNSFIDPISVIGKICKIADRVVIDCPMPKSILDLGDVEDHRAVIELNPMSSQMQITDDNPVTFQGSRVSLRAIEMIGGLHGFRSDREPYQQLAQLAPDVYGRESDNRRLMSVLIRDRAVTPPATYQDIYG